MSDLIIEGAKGIPDGLYVIKDGELFKYKPNRGTVYTVRSYHVTDRPKGKWIKATESTWKCNLCNGIMYVESDYCPFCGADMRSE